MNTNQPITIEGNTYSLQCDQATLATKLDFLKANPADLAELLCKFSQVSDKTRQAYRKAISYFFDYLFQRQISKPSSLTVREYKETMLDAGKKPATVNLYLAGIRQLFSFLSSIGAYPNVCFGLKKAKDGGEQVKKLPLSKEQAVGFLTEREGEDLLSRRNKAIAYVLIETGIRSVSCRELKVEDYVHMGKDTLLYYRSKGSHGKSMVVVPAKCAEAIDEYLSSRGTAKPTDPLFISLHHANYGEPISERGFRDIVKNDLKAHGFNSSLITTHSLRHSHATLELNAGVPILEVSHEMNHAKVTTTQAYLHLSTGIENAPSKSLEEYLFNA